MPTVFPVQVKVYDGGEWSADTIAYTPEALEMWADLDDNHGYYWFGNEWNIIDVNVAYDNVTIDANAQGQLQIKASAADNDKIMRCVNGQAMWVTAPATVDVRFYTGNGLYGPSNPKSIAYSFVPKIVFIFIKYATSPLCVFYKGDTQARTGAINGYSYVQTVTWPNGGKTLQWYCSSNGSSMLNEENVNYCVVALG